jgi:hypothetical protein
MSHLLRSLPRLDFRRWADADNIKGHPAGWPGTASSSTKRHRCLGNETRQETGGVDRQTWSEHISPVPECQEAASQSEYAERDGIWIHL